MAVPKKYFQGYEVYVLW